ncbi:oxygenase MpaB family protein [Oscillatoria salina]|uniref:oxygenase MpaB family protein n=1 Tax=Oscillatoria salina TaxID=331517 RepID=UPI0013B855F1|nr:oxygenase MpaB family protein [Oscillatoria salina]MBZ8181637.1 DUF2236 domain-containing protein [Oscillatoria salina IIICB1]NET88680.1 DUF2236 domain-containing protein [Kamptonema sp. SIO1D9]
MSKYHNLQRIQQLDPQKDRCKICHLIAGYEFPWDVVRALEIALLRTFCVPSISQLLNKTGEFRLHTQKRYDDTALLVAEIIKWGYDSDRGSQAIQRMNQIHGRFPISNEDFLYVLSTFIYEPIRWNQRFGWRLMCETEKQACYYFWQAIGERMEIKNIPPNYTAFEQFNLEYERENFHYSATNRQVGEATIKMFLGWFPSWLSPVLRPGVYAMLDEKMLDAFGFPHPSPQMRSLVENSLKLRGNLVRILPPRTQPEFFTDSQLRSYPQGYKLTDLGPKKMLDSLNQGQKLSDDNK